MDQVLRDRHLGSDDCICKSDSEPANWAKFIITLLKTPLP
jgi:hypothetical protein